MLFEKCTNYIETFNQKEKAYQDIFKVLKGLENKYAVQFSKEYQS